MDIFWKIIKISCQLGSGGSDPRLRHLSSAKFLQHCRLKETFFEQKKFDLWFKPPPPLAKSWYYHQHHFLKTTSCSVFVTLNFHGKNMAYSFRTTTTPRSRLLVFVKRYKFSWCIRPFFWAFGSSFNNKIHTPTNVVLHEKITNFIPCLTTWQHTATCMHPCWRHVAVLTLDVLDCLIGKRSNTDQSEELAAKRLKTWRWFCSRFNCDDFTVDEVVLDPYISSGWPSNVGLVWSSIGG